MIRFLQQESLALTTTMMDNTLEKESLNPPLEKDRQDVMIHEILELIKSDASMSQELLKSKIDNQSTSLLRTFIADQTQGIFKFYTELDEIVRDIIVSSLKTTLQKTKKVKSLFLQTAESNNLHFYIVLKKDSEDNRTIMYDHLDEYEKLALSNKFEVCFHFISADISGNLKKNTQNLF